MTRKTFTYTHGDTGTKPPSGLDFAKNERPNAQNFDWYWYNVTEAIKGHAAEFTRLDSDNDGQVDSADYADNAGNADNADTVDGFQASAFLQKSGDTMSGDLTLNDNSLAASRSWVNSQPSSVDTRTSDPSTPSDGQTWIRTDL